MSVANEARPGPGVQAPADVPRERARGSPVTILRVYAALLILIPPTYIVEPLGGVGTPATVVALGALLLWGVGALVPGNHLCRTVMPVRVVMGLLVGSTLLSYGVAHVHHVPGVELLASDRAVLQVLSWAGVALLAAEGLRDRAELYAVLRVVVGAIAVMAVVGLLQFRAGVDLTVHFSRIPGLHLNAEHVAIQDRSGFNRPAGTAGHPIEFGSVIAMALPVALHLARFDVARPTIRRWLPVVAIAIGVPVAVSRSAVLAALVAAVVVFVGLERRYRLRALAAAAGFLLVTYVTTPGLLGILRDLFTNFSTDSSITYRTDDYETVEQYVLESPGLGRGPGTFLPANSHTILDNQYLMTAIELGLWGLVIVVCYLSAAAFLGRGARHASTDRTVRDLGQALAATGLAGAGAAGTFDGLPAAASAARLHRGVATGAGGPAIAELEVSHGTSGELSGDVELRVEFAPTFDFARGETSLELCPGGCRAWGAQQQVLRLSSPVPMQITRGAATAALQRRAGETCWLVLTHGAPALGAAAARMLDRTTDLEEMLRVHAEPRSNVRSPRSPSGATWSSTGPGHRTSRPGWAFSTTCWRPWPSMGDSTSPGLPPATPRWTTTTPWRTAPSSWDERSTRPSGRSTTACRRRCRRPESPSFPCRTTCTGASRTHRSPGTCPAGTDAKAARERSSVPFRGAPGSFSRRRRQEPFSCGRETHQALWCREA